MDSCLFWRRDPPRIDATEWRSRFLSNLTALNRLYFENCPMGNHWTTFQQLTRHRLETLSLRRRHLFLLLRSYCCCYSTRNSIQHVLLLQRYIKEKKRKENASDEKKGSLLLLIRLVLSMAASFRQIVAFDFDVHGWSGTLLATVWLHLFLYSKWVSFLFKFILKIQMAVHVLR